ncbi:hypothetical protein PIB30_064529 [Stylosanthes scabra]|uniref:UspA domain-containing protein n=1 Tax=Stylosanthes scabra TaxID=79078 RepID=A0ABU6SMN2_9FABA|nr:hypothetical protein [Stylosanthes scabra]
MHASIQDAAGGGGSGSRNGNQSRKVMVVADPTRESAGALQYALAHAVVDHDELILLHVENPNSWRNTLSTILKMPSLGSSTTASMDVGGGSTGGRGGSGAVVEGEGVDFLEEMKHACKGAQPKVKVRAMKVEIDKDRATTILFHSKTQKVDVIVIGQKRNITSALLGYRRSGGGSMKGARMIDTAEYLIQHSTCTCVAVQRKGQHGGYVLNTKTQRNFWLLA